MWCVRPGRLVESWVGLWGRGVDMVIGVACSLVVCVSVCFEVLGICIWGSQWQEGCDYNESLI